MRKHVHPTFVRGAAALLGMVIAACDSADRTILPEEGGGGPTLNAVLVAPEERSVQAGATLQFQAAGVMSDGDTTDVAVSWSATGGTITSAGLYTAGQTAGVHRVVATAEGGQADTARVTVTVPSPNPTLMAVVATPPSASVATGGTVQFSATGRLSNGASQAVNVTWTATGGTINTSGLYTAGATAGSYRVIATGPGGLADTSAVTVTSTSTGTPGQYSRIVGDDWKGYQSKAQLKAADQFWWFRSGDVWNEVDLVQDPTFGQVARIRFLQSTEADWAPKLSASFTPRDKIWYRWRMKYSPGWTTVGTTPAGYNNAYKVAFWLWDGYEGRGQVEIANTSEYVLGWRVSQPNGGAALQYTQRELPGSQSWGHVSTEFTDNQWWEYVIYYEKTGTNSARNHWWKRRLTNNGAIANNPWTYIGIEVTGATTPRVNGIMLGANKNRNNTSTAYIYWGPWEVVDGSQYRNPFGMPNM